MGINKLRHFILTYETGSIRKSAEILSMSPGSLSKSISSLEDEFGQDLFLPNGRNIRPSEYARTVYSDCKNIIEQYDSLHSSSKQFTIKTNQHIKVATWEVFSSYLIAQFAKQEKQSPSIIRVLERAPGDLEKSILNNEADFGISYAPVPNPALDYLKISNFKFSAFSTKGTFSNKQVKDIPFAIPITYIEDSSLSVKSLDNWPLNKLRKIKYEFELLESALETTRQGLSAIYCPDFVIKLQNASLQEKFRLYEIEQLKSRRSKNIDVFLVKRKSFPENQISKKLAKTIRKFCS